nr:MULTISPECIES: hypothetical protein [unclassified Mesorhizobium]
MAAGRALTEASGRMTPKTAPAIAATGVDLISVGWLTHSSHPRHGASRPELQQASELKERT